MSDYEGRYYDAMSDNETLSSELESLRQQLTSVTSYWEASKAENEQQRVSILVFKKVLQDVLDTHGYNTNDGFVAAEQTRKALAATADLKDVRLCHAEPVAWQTFDGEGGYDYRSYEDNEDYRDDYIKRNSSQKFYENWVIPLYRAW
jgi:hypothetical protein